MYKLLITVLLFMLCNFLSAQVLPSTKAKTPAQKQTIKSNVVTQQQNKNNRGSATLKIMSDAAAKVYVDGIFKKNISGGVAYSLPLAKGIYEVKVISQQYPSVFDIKEQFEVESNDQQDFWKVALIKGEVKFKSEDLLRTHGGKITTLIKNCMVSNFSKPDENGYTYKRDYAIDFKSYGAIEFIEHRQLLDKENKIIGDWEDITTLSGIDHFQFYESKYLNEPPFSILFGGSGTLQNKEKKTYTYESKETSVLNVPISETCKADLERALRPLFKD